MIISQKPHEIDLSLRYVCPNEECKLDHWLFLREAKTPNYLVVCECGVSFSPKTINKVKILYTDEVASGESKNTDLDTVLNTCIKTLITYGFDEDESRDLVKRAYNKCGSHTKTLIIKTALEIFGDN